MPNIKNLSSLRNYTTVLDEVKKGSPVFIMREGRGKYAIVDMDEYDEMRSALWQELFRDLDTARQSAEDEGWTPLDVVKESFGIHG